MRGLIMKDMLTIARQAKAFLILILFFAVTPNFSGSSFALVYTAMMPISALAYDENCKWDQLAATVWVSKYALKDSDGNIYEESPQESVLKITFLLISF